MEMIGTMQNNRAFFSFYDVDLIKVITGIRRCGKSVILTQIVDELKDLGVDTNHIIYLNFESKRNSFIKNDDDLYNYVNEKYVISTDTFDLSQNGIIHKNIIDWLLEE